MNSITPSIEFFAGIPEELSDVRLRRDPISIEPKTSKLFWQEQGDDSELAKIEIVFDVGSTDHWDRFMRFMERYSEANGWEFTSTPTA